MAASCISPEIAAARGYRSIETKADLERKGFSRAQRNVPGLLIPVYNIFGECATYQYRPDEPRVNKDGKIIKYETPSGSRMVLDVPRLAQKWMGDPRRPLGITEGARKADAAVSVDLCCIALLGVWNWRGTNEQGGKTTLADWEQIALKGRDVYLAFDSDVATKREVYAALARLKAFLEQRGAHVKVIYLPSCDGGGKQGLDDFLAAGHSLDDLLALASSDLRAPPEGREDGAGDSPYRQTRAGLVWLKPTASGPVATPLTNFTAKIVADVAEDDGAEVLRRFEIEAAVNGRSMRFTTPASHFPGMNWATEHLGAGAVVYPGFGTKDHARVAVQLLSGTVPERRVYTHTGWRQISDEWVYLHAGGAIGAGGAVEGIEVALPGALARYMLPKPPDGAELIGAIRGSLRMLDLASDLISVPLFATAWRAPLGSTDLTVHVAGPTGAGKTELVALVQQHYGADMDARHLPAGWASTGNALEGLAFQAKDAVLVVDDFAPTGSTTDVQRYHREADRLMRAQGNQAGRGRMRSDGSLRPTKSPRGLTVSTGEDVPRGQSLRARLLVLELAPGDLKWESLTSCQLDAANGLYAQALAGYLRWLAAKHDDVAGRLRDEVTRLRTDAASSAMHRRTPEIVANLAVGVRYFLDFAEEAGAVNAQEAHRLRERCWRALGEAAQAQAHHQAASEPAQRFLELVSGAVASGKAHLAGADGGEPDSPGSWGWRQSTVGTGDCTRLEWRPQGDRIGWLDGDALYLEPDAAYGVIQRLASATGETLTVGLQTLKRRLRDKRLLVTTDRARQTFTVRRTIEGRRLPVLHLDIRSLSTLTEPDQPDQDGETRAPGQVSRPGSEGQEGQPDQHADQGEGPKIGEIASEMLSEPSSRNTAGQVGQDPNRDREQVGGTGAGLVRLPQKSAQNSTSRPTNNPTTATGNGSAMPNNHACVCGGRLFAYTPSGRPVCERHEPRAWPCYACGSPRWWARRDGGWECVRCHPAPTTDAVLEEVEVGA